MNESPVKLDNGLWARYCPTCSSEVTSSSRSNCVAAIKAGRLCKVCGAKKAARPGNRNPFYGRKHSEESKAKIRKFRLEYYENWSEEDRQAFSETMKDVYEEHHRSKPRKSNVMYWTERYGPDEAATRHELFKSRLSEKMAGEGNPMFGKPSPGGSGYGWKGFLDGKRFKSLRELRFMLDNPEAEYAETSEWRATYLWQGRKRTTVPDFALRGEKRLIECKPTKLINTLLVQEKAKALTSHAESLGYTYEIVDPGIVEMPELTDLIENGRVVLSETTQRRREDWLIKHNLQLPEGS